MARPEGLEPPAPWFEAKCSIQLSYGRSGSIVKQFSARTEFQRAILARLTLPAFDVVTQRDVSTVKIIACAHAPAPAILQARPRFWP
jgi:hypothetical protein